jgi:CCR4-NOT transcriptional regulation complex NOT5 subunit
MSKKEAEQRRALRYIASRMSGLRKYIEEMVARFLAGTFARIAAVLRPGEDRADEAEIRRREHAQKVLVEGLKQCWEVRSNPEAVERVVFDILAPADRLTAEDLAWAEDRLREIKS